GLAALRGGVAEAGLRRPARRLLAPRPLRPGQELPGLRRDPLGLPLLDGPDRARLVRERGFDLFHAAGAGGDPADGDRGKDVRPDQWPPRVSLALSRGIQIPIVWKATKPISQRTLSQIRTLRIPSSTPLIASRPRPRTIEIAQPKPMGVVSSSPTRIITVVSLERSFISACSKCSL